MMQTYKILPRFATYDRSFGPGQRLGFAINTNDHLKRDGSGSPQPEGERIAQLKCQRRGLPAYRPAGSGQRDCRHRRTAAVPFQKNKPI